MLGEMIRSWKYPTRLVMVIRVPIGAFRLFFLVSSASAGVATVGRLKWRSSFGVLTLSLSDLSASRLASKASTVLSSSEESESSELVSVLDPRRASFDGPANLSDTTRGKTLLHPEAGLVPLGVLDPLRICVFSSDGDMARPGTLEEIASPQLFCLDRC